MKKNQKQLDIDSVEDIQLEMMRRTDCKVRGQHFKQHGCLIAEFKILEDIPKDLKIGLFSQPSSYKAYLRFSNGGKLDDRQADIHGMAIKLVGVTGSKILEGQEDANTHDFILADNPVFFIRTASDYVPFIEEFSQGKPPEKFAARRIKDKHPEDLTVLKNFSQHTIDSPLSTKYWSQVPYALGLKEDTICRYHVEPSQTTAPHSNESERDENYLRKVMKVALCDTSECICFDFYIQPLKDTSYEVVNNPTVEWDVPCYKVATITIKPQEFDTDKQNFFGENLSFTPWHALPEHRPVGEVNEIRKQVYLGSSELRHCTNGTPIKEQEE
jgi:catalase